jgi:hypothetical protein
MSYILEDIQNGKNNRATAELLDRAPALQAVISEARGVLANLEDTFERRDVGDDNLHDPDDLDEWEEEESADAVRLLAKLIHLLTATDLSARTTAAVVAHWNETGTILPKEA